MCLYLCCKLSNSHVESPHGALFALTHTLATEEPVTTLQHTERRFSIGVKRLTMSHRAGTLSYIGVNLNIHIFVALTMAYGSVPPRMCGRS